MKTEINKRKKQTNQKPKQTLPPKGLQTYLRFEKLQGNRINYLCQQIK